MLDINLFRVEKGGNPDVIRESQRRRFANVDLVDEVIKLDKEWRQRIVPRPCPTYLDYVYLLMFLISLI